MKKIDEEIKQIEANEEPVPYYLFNAITRRFDDIIKRLYKALIIAIVLIFATNGIWLLYIYQYDFESYEVSADGNSNANYIGGDGDITNGGIGESSQANEENQQEQGQGN